MKDMHSLLKLAEVKVNALNQQLSEAKKELEASRLECEALKQSNNKVIMDAVAAYKEEFDQTSTGAGLHMSKWLIEYANNKET